MNTNESYPRATTWSLALLLTALGAGCGGGGDSGAPAPGDAPAAADKTRPRVTLTVPATTIPGPTVGVPTNTAITVTFSENMDPATLGGIAGTTNFTLTGPGATPVTGTVTYAVGASTATFTPTTPATLPASTLFTATITTGATDLAGNALAGNQSPPLPEASTYVWTFTTDAAPDTTPPTVTLLNPADLATDVALNSDVNATFSEAMKPSTIIAIAPATLTLQVFGPPLGSLLGGTTVYDALSKVATFTPSSPLAASTKYTATITTAAQDLAGNALTSNKVWTFTTGTGLAPGAVPLGRAGSFGIMATGSIASTGASIINGDVALTPGTSMTGFTLPLPPSGPGVVNGNIHIDDQTAMDAQTDLTAAYTFAKNLAPGTPVGAGADLGALYPGGIIPPGTYTSGSTMSVQTPVVLDAGGNADAVWVFQIGSSLTTTTPAGHVSLAGGALEKNVFWVPTAAATIGVGTIFYGTILAGGDVVGQTGATINGRILAGALTGTLVLDTNTVNVPAP